MFPEVINGLGCDKTRKLGHPSLELGPEIGCLQFSAPRRIYRVEDSVCRGAACMMAVALCRRRRSHRRRRVALLCMAVLNRLNPVRHGQINRIPSYRLSLACPLSRHSINTLRIRTSCSLLSVPHVFQTYGFSQEQSSRQYF